jgi:CheY-like chemotaxis protein
MVSLKCLIVDDDIDLCLTFREILNIEGFDADYCTSSTEALQKISEVMYDLIFLDVNLPEISGIELLERIPRISKNKPNCIMVTGDSDSEVIISAMNAGAIGYLVKPIDIIKLSELLTKIKNSIDRNPINIHSANLSNLGPDEKKLIENILTNRLSKISLQFRDIDPVYPGIRVNEKWMTTMKKLNKLSDKNLLKKEEKERVILCPSCDSLETYSRYSCPSCKSTKIDRLNLLQHIKCGHTGYKKEFENDFDYVCPRCSEKNYNPSEYKIIGTVFECQDCGNKFNKPNINHYCKRCGEYFDYTNSRYITIYDYSITNLLKEQLPDEEPTSTQVNEQLVTN